MFQSDNNSGSLAVMTNLSTSSISPDTPDILNTILNFQQQSQSQTPPLKFPTDVNKIADDLKACLVKEGLRWKVNNNSNSNSNKRKREDSDSGKENREDDRVKVEIEEETVAKQIKREVDSEGEETDIKEKKPKVKSEVEEERRRRRRARNKIAATKCREKKKLRAQTLVKDHETLTEQNERLNAEVVRLTREKRVLDETLSAHRSCNCKLAKARWPSLDQVQATYQQQQQQSATPQILVNDQPIPLPDLDEFDLLQSTLASYSDVAAVPSHHQQQCEGSFADDQFGLYHFFMRLDAQCANL